MPEDNRQSDDEEEEDPDIIAVKKSSEYQMLKARNERLVKEVQVQVIYSRKLENQPSNCY